MRNAIRALIEAAIRAPSGENAQPWHFSVSESAGATTIEVRVASERDESLYNWEKRASYFSIGAALENMRVTAPGVGLSLDIRLFPDHDDPIFVARIICAKTSDIRHNVLQNAIAERVTNRKPYRTVPLPKEDMEALARAAKDAEKGIALHLTDRSEDIKALGKVGSANEEILLGNEKLHGFFFSHVNWTKEEDDENKAGFYIRTLELPPPARFGFKVARKWKRAKFLNAWLGFNKTAAAQNAKIYAKAAAVGVVTASVESPENAIKAGMVLERVWLEATQRGLSFQPMAGLPYLYLRTQAGEPGIFSPDELNLLQKQFKTLADTFSLRNETVYFMFRVGVSAPPSARSLRFPLEQVVTMNPSEGMYTSPEPARHPKESRSSLIDRILKDLEAQHIPEQAVPVKHLIDFFKAAKNGLSYFFWMVAHAPFLKQGELLELADLAIAEWEEMFYPLMIENERLPFPGLVEPLVTELTRRISTGKFAHCIHLGSGPMEIERQVIGRLRKQGSAASVTFVGIDLAQAARRTATENLSASGILVQSVDTKEKLFEKLAKDPEGIRVVLYAGDAIPILETFPFSSRDLVFHSLFRHHLSALAKRVLDELVSKKRIPVIEYDGYRNWFVTALFSMGTWKDPVIMNGAVYSNRRYDTKKKILERKPGAEFFFPSAAYLAFDNLEI